MKLEKKALSDAYLALMVMDGWKELEEFAKNEKQNSLNRIENKSARDLTIGEICEEIGIRKGITKILRHAEDSRLGV